MTELMTAVVLDGRGGVELVEKPVPQPMDREILIAPRATGVCGTDLHLIDGTFTLSRYPVTPGHEFAGLVARLGAGVTGFHEGDLVCADPNVTCGTCRWCRAGALNHCPELDPLGLTRDGACAEYVSVPQANVFALPSGVTAEVGALIEPLSCVLHAARRTPGWSGARVAVFGAGPIGLLAIAVALHRGAASVVAFELHEGRRRAARTVGAEAAHADIAQDDGGGLFDIAVEASGQPSAIAAALKCLGPMGRLLQMGAANPDVTLPLAPSEVFAKELMIIGSFSVADAYPEAVEIIPDLASTLAPLVTERVALTQYREALAQVTAPSNIKVVIVPD
jgi:threonine dehydrogenase-like Zn-dependent dehydrogenase